MGGEGTNEAPSSRMSTKRRRTGQSSSRSGAAREPPQQQLLPDDIEKENAAILDKLPREVWEKIVGSLRRDDDFPFALTCRYFRDLRQSAVATKKRSTFWTVLDSYTYMYSVDDDMCFSPTIEDDAIYGGRLPVSADYLKWLFGETRSTYCRETALAARPRWDGKPRYVAAQGEQNLMELAAIVGDLNLIKWLRNQDPPCKWSKKACTAAAWANRWDLLRNLVSMGCPIDKGGMFGVVVRDPEHVFKQVHLPEGDWGEKFEILKWLQREQGCTFWGYWMHSHVRNVTEAAIYYDDLECLQWVRAHGLSWDTIVLGEHVNYGLEEIDFLYASVDVCGQAARRGHLEILQYAVEDGCPWDPATCLKAAEREKHDHVVKWITNYARETSSSESYES